MSFIFIFRSIYAYLPLSLPFSLILYLHIVQQRQQTICKHCKAGGQNLTCTLILLKVDKKKSLVSITINL